MRFVTAAEMRELDLRAVSQHAIRGTTLMRRAGLAVAEAVRRLAVTTGVTDQTVLLVAGYGNNGGDVFAAAAELLAWGFRVKVRVAAEASRVGGDSQAFRNALPAGVVEVLSSSSQWDADDPAVFPRGTIFVDGVLGTGAHGAPRGAVASAIQWLRRAAAVGRIVAVDLPSGMDADSGACSTPHVVADLTVCLALPKTGLRSASALAACGRVEMVDIGFPAALTGETETDGWGWIGEPELCALVPARPRDAHKGVFGHVLIVGGSLGFSGAATLATGGALRSGVGLASVWTPRTISGMVATAFPEAMVHGMGSDTAECLHPAILGADWLSACTAHDAVVLGPGLSQRAGTADVVDGVLASGANRIVLDADALNLLAGRTERLRNLRSQLVLTPHPGEAGRLLGTSAAAVQADRPAALRALVEQTGATVVLKGAGTLVGTPGRGIHMLLAGNPGMATGGSGDVLAGLLGGLLAQGMAPFDAARMAVWWHAAAGDLAAWQGTQASLTAADILRCLPAAARWVMVR